MINEAAAIIAEGTTILYAYLDTIYRIVISRGGTRSSKTYSGAQLGVLWLLYADSLVQMGFDFPVHGVFSYVRKTLPSLKASAYRDFKEILDEKGLLNRVKENKTELTFTYGNRMVEFFSIDQPQKVRSRKRAIIYVVEGNEIDYKNDFQQLIFRTTHRFYLDFNPDDEDIWINREIEEKRFFDKKDVDIIISNYTNNPYLSKEIVDEIEYTKLVDPELWQVYGMGQYGKITGLVYPNKPEIIESFPEDRCKVIMYGLDFGFKDPMALMKIGVNDSDLYIEEKLYERGLTTTELIAKLPSLGVYADDYIYFDSASPGQGQEIYNAGYYMVLPAQKGKDSIIAGINVLKKYKWHVVAGSDNFINERRKYKWALDKNGEPVTPAKPLDLHNHAMDATRYPVFTHFYEPQRDYSSWSSFSNKQSF